MKKKLLIVSLTVFLITACVYVYIYIQRGFLFGTSTQTFQVNQQADFYLLTEKSIFSYQLNNNVPSELDHQSIQLSENVHPWLQKGELHNRYLLFSAGDEFDSTKDERIVSIDFKEGQIKKQYTPYYAYSGSGISDNFFYTSQATTEDSTLYAFDENGNLKKSFFFNEATTPAAQFFGANGKLYFLATQIGRNDDSIYEHTLFILDETPELKINEKIFLDDNSEYAYGFYGMEIIDDTVYAPIPMIRDRKTHEKLPYNFLFKMNLKTKEKHFIELEENDPLLVLKSKNEKYLILQHDTSTLGKIGISVVDLKTENNYFINIGELVSSQDLFKDDIVSMNTTTDNRLFVLTKKFLLIFDLQSGTLLSPTAVPEDEIPIYIWVN